MYVFYVLRSAPVCFFSSAVRGGVTTRTGCTRRVARAAVRTHLQLQGTLDGVCHHQNERARNPTHANTTASVHAQSATLPQQDQRPRPPTLPPAPYTTITRTHIYIYICTPTSKWRKRTRIPSDQQGRPRKNNRTNFPPPKIPPPTLAPPPALLENSKLLFLVVLPLPHAPPLTSPRGSHRPPASPRPRSLPPPPAAATSAPWDPRQRRPPTCLHA